MATFVSSSIGQFSGPGATFFRFYWSGDWTFVLFSSIQSHGLLSASLLTSWGRNTGLRGSVFADGTLHRFFRALDVGKGWYGRMGTLYVRWTFLCLHLFISIETKSGERSSNSLPRVTKYEYSFLDKVQ